MIELFECLPMSAKISLKQCAHNRKQADDHRTGKMADIRCVGCAGLGESTIIDSGEIMANKHCSEKGCDTVSWKQGFCWKHHPDHVANKKAACADKQAIRDIHKAALVQIEDIVLCDECGNDPCLCVIECADTLPVTLFDVQEITNIDYMAFMRQKFDEKFEEWATDLNKARTPYERAQRYIHQCDAIIGMGY